MESIETRLANLSDEQRKKLQHLMEKKKKAEMLARKKQDGYTVPCSFAQQRLWFFDQLAGGNSLYNTPIMSRIRGPLQVDVLERALQEIGQRQESLRTTFKSVEGHPVQVIAPELQLPLAVSDLSHLPLTEREAVVQERVQTEAQYTFDLAQGPLVRWSLLRVADDEHVLMLNFHHIIFDGWSNEVFWKELAALYDAYSQGLPSPLPELPIQYADYAIWHRKYLEGPEMAQHVQYWQQQLEGVPTVVELPTDRPAPKEQSFRGKTLVHLLPARLHQALKERSRSENATLFMTVLAGYAALIGRYSGMEEFLIGTVSAGRDRAELEPLIGFFVNMLPLRMNLTGNPSLRELLQRIKQTLGGAFAHQNMPFERLVEMAHVDRSASQAPLVQVSFSLRNDGEAFAGFSGLTVEPLNVVFDLSRFTLTFDLVERPDGLLLNLAYSTDLFEEATILRMVTHFQNMLLAIIEHPEMAVSELPLLTEAERRQLLVEWNDTDKEYPEAQQCVHTRFEAIVARDPDAVAVVYEGQQLTYRELNERANQVAHVLRAHGVGPDMMTSICVDRSLQMIVGVLGILKAGAAYVPIDPNYPADRIAFMLEDAESTVILTEERYADRVTTPGVKTLLLDRDWAELFAPQSTANPENRTELDHLAYVIFTSGSTGRPKGVMIEHRAASNFLSSSPEMLGMTPADHVLQFASLSFDVSVFEIFATLLTGATLYLAEREKLLSPEGLTEQLQLHRISVADLPPAMLGLLDPDELPDLRVLFVGMEAFTAELVNRWTRLPERKFVNAYGPTEATVAMTFMDCRGIFTQSPPIGPPMPNHQAFVLDRSLQPVPIGVPGELYIGGTGLARGYLKRPDLTAERFIANPFRPGTRMYKTGDLVRWLPTGVLEFIGRADSQVKIRGFRIELGEIEAQLQQHPAVKQAVVIVRDDLPGGKGLAAYYVPEADHAELTAGDVRRFLAERLPAYMVPAVFVRMEKLPLSPTGKLDRKALPAPSLDRSQSGVDFVAPRTRTEEVVAAEFGSVLQIAQVGATDHFFHLGGHSLMATQLIAKLHRAFGVKLPLRSLFAAPTVMDLAELIEQTLQEKGAGEQQRSAVVKLTSGNRTPLFCVHPVGGGVFAYVELAQQLSVDCTMYAFEAPGLEGEQEPLPSVAALAARYLQELRQLQPQGPYRIAGWSMGGLVAYELAQQLQAAGEEVALLALFDTFLPETGSQPAEQESFAYFAHDLAGLLGCAFPAFDAAFYALPLEARLQTLLAIAQQQGYLAELRLSELQHRFRVFAANSQAMYNYAAQPFAGTVTLLRASELLVDAAEDLGWSRLAGRELKLIAVPGNHYTMLKAPHVAQVADQLRACLNS